MTTEELVKTLMDTMVDHNYSLGQAQAHVTHEFLNHTQEAATLIRNAFERDGSLTPNTKV